MLPTSPFLTATPESTDLLLFNSNPLPCFIIEKDTLKISAANESAFDFHKNNRSNLIGSSFPNLFKKENRLSLVRKIKADGNSFFWKELVEQEASGGNTISIELLSSLVTIRNKKYFQIICVDVTSKISEQRKLKTENERYHAYIDNCSEGIFRYELTEPVPIDIPAYEMLNLIKERAVLAECNIAMIKMSGYNKAVEIIGKSPGQLFDFNNPNNISYMTGFIENGFKTVDVIHEKEVNGELRYFLNNLTGIVKDGCLLRIWGSQKDITHKKEIEERIKVLANLVEETSEVLNSTDLDFKVITWNKASEEVFGVSKKQIIGKYLDHFIQFTYKDTTIEELKKAINEKGEWRGEMEFVRPTDKKTVIIIAGFRLLKNEDGTPIGHIIAATDITERKRIEERIQMLANLVEETSEVLNSADMDFKVITWNKASEEVFGISEAEIVGKHLRQLIQLTYKDTTIEEVRKTTIEKGEWRGELHFVRPTDKKMVMLIATFKVLKDENGIPVGHIIAATDITEQKKADERIKLLANLVEETSEVLNFTDLDYNVITWNKASEEIFGMTEAEIVGKPLRQFIDLIYTDSAVEEVRRRTTENGEWRGELHFVRPKDKKMVMLIATLKVFKDENGIPIGHIISATDITEQKIADERIRLLANLVEQTADVLTAANLDFKAITWNKGAEKIYGLTATQAIGKNIRDYIDLHYKGITREEVRKTLILTGEWRGEMYFIRPTDKKLITILTTFKTLRDESSTPVGYVVAATDITESKEAELNLRESESRFRAVADTAPVMIWMSNAGDRLSYINKLMADQTGIDIATGKATLTSLIHPDEKDANVAKFNLFYEKKFPVTLIYRLKTVTGDYRWVQDSSKPRLLEDGTFLGYIGSISDIHDTKLKEEALRYQATILENVPDILVTTDLDFIIKSWNKTAEEIYGHSEEKALNRLLTDMVKFDNAVATFESLKAGLEGEGSWVGEVIYKDKNGEVRYFIHTVTYVYDSSNEKIGIMTVGRDITDRVEVEKKLKQSEMFYRSLIADSLDGMLLTDSLGIISFASTAVQKILGYEPEDVIGKSVFDFVFLPDQGKAFDIFQRGIIEHPEVESLSVRLIKKSGKWLWCSVRGFNMLGNPYVSSIVIYFHDDTVRKQASALLKASEQHFRKLISDLQTGVLLLDAYGKVLMSNNVLCAMLKVSEKALLQTHFWKLYKNMVKENGLLYKEKQRPIDKVLHTKKLVRNVVIGLQQPFTEERLWLIVNADPILDSEGLLINIVCSFTDITERKKLEQKLLNEEITRQKQLTQATIDGQEKERREIGKELHDNIGQQLTTSKLYLEMAGTMNVDDAAEMVNRASKSIVAVINEIRGISRALVPQTLGDLGLIDSVVDLVETIRRIQPLSIEVNHIDFHEDQTPDNQKLTLFRIIQEQLNNIVKHAKATCVTILLRNTQPILLLRIEDNGQGFDTGKIKRTLGLTNIKNRAELFGGEVEIASATGYGCTVSVTIPMEVHAVRK